MRLTGTLRTWKDDRGFGFIAPTHGGAELFVHISALPRDGSRPTVGERVTYELGRGRDGKPQAVNVERTAIGPSAASTRSREPAPARDGPSWLSRIVTLLLVAGLAAFGYKQYQKYSTGYSTPAPAFVTSPSQIAEPIAQDFSCDGRKYCSQMHSCTEAKYFLKNCPGTQMDGNHDGVPCEQQWCTSPFAK
ncbi:MAG: cold shock domain-containing protein [Variovorax sp.]